MKKPRIIRLTGLIAVFLFALGFAPVLLALDRIPVNILSEGSYRYEAALVVREEGGPSPLRADFNPLTGPLRLSPVYGSYHEKPLWLQFRLRNDSGVTQNTIIHPAGYFPSVATMVLFTKNGKRLGVWEAGLNSRFAQREGSSYQSYFQVQLAPGEESIAVIRVQQEALLSPKIILNDASSWDRIDQDRAMFLGVAIGACITLLIYSFFLYWRLRDSVLMSYLLLVSSTLLAVSYWSGLHATWMEAYSPWQLALFPMIPRLSGLSLLLLSLFLVRLPERKPLWNSFLFGLIGMSLLTMLMQTFFPHAMSRLGDLCQVLMLSMAVFLLWKRAAETSDRYLLLIGSGAAFCLSGSAWMLVRTYLKGELIELALLSISLILGTLLISVGLILRMQSMRRMLQIGLRRELMLQEETVFEQQIQLKELLQELGDAKERAEAAEKRLGDQSQESLDIMRLQAIGGIASHLAEEAGTPLGEITRLSEGLMREARSGRTNLKNLRSAAGSIFRLAARLQHIMRNLQRAASSADDQSLFLVNDFIRDCLDLCQDRLIRQGVEIEVELSEDDLWIEGNFARLSEAFLALLQNAGDAVASSDVKRIAWQVRRIDENEGSWLLLQLSDSGLGVPTSVRDLIFRPSVTTKRSASGMGLTRAMAILQRHGGSVVLDPDAVATTFIVRLPLYNPAQRLAG